MFSFLSFFSKNNESILEVSSETTANRLLDQINSDEKSYYRRTKGKRAGFAFSVLLMISSIVGSGVGMGFLVSKELDAFNDLKNEIKDMTNSSNAGKPGYECYNQLNTKFSEVGGVNFCKSYSFYASPTDLFSGLPPECRDYCETIRHDTSEKNWLGFFIFATSCIAIIVIGAEIKLAFHLGPSLRPHEFPFELSETLKKAISHFLKDHPLFLESDLTSDIGGIKDILKDIIANEEKPELSRQLLLS